MSRDPIQHEEHLLIEGLRRVEDGGRLDDMPTVRAELIHLGLVITARDGQLKIMREGRALLDSTT